MERTGEARKAKIAAETPELAGELDEVVIDPPDRTFASSATVEVGGREVALRYLGRGHTDHDIVISVPGTDVVFAGDLLENGAVPFYGDAYPVDWAATAAQLALVVEPDRGVVVPGHGDHAGRAFADAQAASIACCRDACGPGPCGRDHARGCRRGAPVPRASGRGRARTARACRGPAPRRGRARVSDVLWNVRLLDLEAGSATERRAITIEDGSIDRDRGCRGRGPGRRP